MSCPPPSLITKLESLYSTLQARSESCEKESQAVPGDYRQLCAMCILPKRVLRRIFLYLDFEADIVAVSETCALFNELVRSRSYQLQLFKTHPSKSLRPASSSEAAHFCPPTSLEEAASQFKKYSAVNNYLAQTIKTQDKRIEELNAEINGHNYELRIKNQINSKTLNTVAKLKHDLELAGEQNALLQGTAAQLATQHSEELAGLSSRLQAVQTANLTLCSHKKVLRSEVLRLRKEYSECLCRLGQHKDVTSKLHSYFEGLLRSKLS